MHLRDNTKNQIDTHHKCHFEFDTFAWRRNKTLEDDTSNTNSLLLFEFNCKEKSVSNRPDNMFKGDWADRNIILVETVIYISCYAENCTYIVQMHICRFGRRSVTVSAIHQLHIRNWWRHNQDLKVMHYNRNNQYQIFYWYISTIRKVEEFIPGNMHMVSALLRFVLFWHPSVVTDIL